MRNWLSKSCCVTFSVVLVTIAFAAKAASPQEIQGSIGADQRYGAGYMDLSPAMSFRAGERLRFHLGGTATKVVVRLLPRGRSYDSPEVIVRDAQVVPPNRTFDVVLNQDYRNVIQISVHGGPNPWGLFPLGAANGPAKLLSVARVR